MTKQVIVVNKGLNMSKGKMSAQVAHACMGPFFKQFLINPDTDKAIRIVDEENKEFLGYDLIIRVDKDCYDWLTSSFTKVICQVKNEKELEKVIEKAKANGFVENVDFVKVIDNGLTEFDHRKTWTCIGFRPMESSKIDVVTKRLQLYKEDEV